MHSDSFFTIGKSHKICEDYAQHGHIKDHEGISRAFCIGSDGCSSAKDTDFGARLLVRAAYDSLKNTWHDQDLFQQLVINKAQVYARTLNLNDESLTSTLLTLHQTNFNIYAYIAGDGVLMYHNNDECNEYGWGILEFAFHDNMPYYLRYELEPDNVERWYKNDILQIDHYDNQDSRIKFDDQRQKPVRPYYEHSFCNELHDIVLIASDGLSSFTKDGKSVPLENVLQELLKFKNLKGEFVQRRCKRFFDTVKELGWKNQDDVFVAGISNPKE